jgi:subtilisin family serine protease
MSTLFLSVLMATFFLIANYSIASAQFANTSNVLNIRDSNILVSNISETGLLPEIIIKLKEPTPSIDNFSEPFIDSLFESESEPIQTLLDSISESKSEVIQTLSDSFQSPVLDAEVAKTNNTNTTFLIDLKPKSESEMPAFFVAPKLEDHLLASLEEIRNNPNVEFAEPNEIYEAQYEEAMTDYNISQLIKQANERQILPYGLDRIDGEIAIDKLKNLSPTTNVDIDIAILDSGISNHSDLNIYRHASFKGKSSIDNCGHGTHVAGIAAAKDNDFGIVGVAPGARLWDVKVLDGKPLNCKASKDSLIKGLDYVAKHADEIDVVNLSLGGFCDPKVRKLCNSPLLEAAINNVIAKGVFIVAASGNKANDAINWKPAKFQSVLTVSNLNDSDGKCGGLGKITHRGMDDFLANNSNYGEPARIAAPGVNITSTYNDGNYQIFSGTSMAAPYVTGAVAMYKSLNHDASHSDIMYELLSKSVQMDAECNGESYGYLIGGDQDNFPEPVLNIKDLIDQ